MPDYQPSARRPIADAFRATARQSVEFCLRRGIDADQVSYASIVVSAVAGCGFWRSSQWPALLIVGAALCYARLWLNMLDGMVALAARTASRRGEILNEMPDRVSDVVIFVGMAHSGWCHPLGGYWAAIFALLTAYVGTFAQALGLKRQFGGVMSKPWRMVVLSAGCLLTFVTRGHGAANGLAGLSILDWTHVIVVAGCVQTIAVRLRRMLQALEAERIVGGTEDPSSDAR